MYPSADIVVFVNIEDFIEAAEKLPTKPVYLCISYDTDLLAMEKITGFVEKWLDLADIRDDITIELRTKSAFFKPFSDHRAIKNFIPAWTLSPEEIITKYEYLTPSLDRRLNAIKKAINNGWNVRLCFDPVIFIKDWEAIYDKFFNKVFDSIPADKISDVSVGGFRVSKEYLKTMRKINPMSRILSYPFEVEKGIATYKREDLIKMNKHIKNKLESLISPDKIYMNIDELK